MARHCPNPECAGLRRDGSVAEFVDTVATCVDCGSTLMLGCAPDESHEPPTFTDLATVWVAGDSVEAHLLRGLLEEAEITVFLKGEALPGALGELPADVMRLAVQVPVEERERARPFVEQFEKGARAVVDRVLELEGGTESDR